MPETGQPAILDEMRVRYLTQLNTKPRILRFYTPTELLFVMFASLAPFACEILLGLEPNILLVAVTWGLLTSIIMVFRIGRPEGFLMHCILHICTPEDFRPGRVRTCDYEYPVADLYENRKNPEDIAAAVLEDACADR